jgi:hypothetical protein
MFYYPEKPKRINNADIVPDNYICQVKKNGHRIIISDDGEFKLRNRDGGTKMSGINEFDWSWLRKVFPKPFYLDGELMGIRQKGIPADTIVIWDALWLKEPLIKVPYIERWKKLKALTGNTVVSMPSKAGMTTKIKKALGSILIAYDIGSHTMICLSNTYPKKEWFKLWQQLDEVYDEGLVFKDGSSTLSWNIRSCREESSSLKLLKKKDA